MLQFSQKREEESSWTTRKSNVGEAMYSLRDKGSGMAIIPQKCYAEGACYRTSVQNEGASNWAVHALWKWTSEFGNVISSGIGEYELFDVV